MTDKKEVREKYIEVRSCITDKDNKSSIIANKLVNDIDFNNAKVVALYKSLKQEVNTDYLIDYLLNIGKIVLLPRVVYDQLVFINYLKEDTLEKSNFGVLEPVYDLNKIYEKEKIDLVIVPGVAFTKDGNRLGFGKGYYDRFLSGSKLKTIGICFKEQICDYLPVDKNDYKLDKVITD